MDVGNCLERRKQTGLEATVELIWLEGMGKVAVRFNRGRVGPGESSMAWAGRSYTGTEPFIIRAPPPSISGPGDANGDHP